MKAIKLANSTSERARLKEKCLSILARAEEIKKIEQWQPSMSHTGSVRMPSEISRVPHSRRQLSTREEVILLEGSKLHGLLFPPWTSVPDEGEFTAPNGEVYTCVPCHHFIIAYLTIAETRRKLIYQILTPIMQVAGEDHGSC
jgi:hypothetical protein